MDLTRALNESEGEVIILGDFDLHHPSWGGPHIRPDHLAEELIQLTTQFDLRLATPVGTPTWKRGWQESTIDLAFTSELLWQRLVLCQPQDSWALT